MAITPSLVKELRERTGLGMMECKKALVESEGNVDLAIENLRKVSGLKAAKKADRTAAEGVVAARVADDGSYGVLVEVNSETDFAARDEGFLAFVKLVVERAFSVKAASVDELINSDLENSRQALVQKIGENIGVRRVEVVQPSAGSVGAYVHSNNRIAVLVEFDGGNTDLAKDVAMHVAALNPQVLSPEDMPASLVDKEKDIIKAQPDMAGKPAEIVEKMMVGRINKFLKENSLLEQAFIKDPDLSVGKLVSNASAKLLGFLRYEVGEGVDKKEEDFAAEVAAQLAASKG